MLRVLWRSGVRVSELVNIRLKDIEWDNCVVNILKAKEINNGGSCSTCLQNYCPLLLSTHALLDNICSHEHATRENTLDGPSGRSTVKGGGVSGKGGLMVGRFKGDGINIPYNTPRSAKAKARRAEKEN
jgi:integrase